MPVPIAGVTAPHSARRFCPRRHDGGEDENQDVSIEGCLSHGDLPSRNARCSRGQSASCELGRHPRCWAIRSGFKTLFCERKHREFALILAFSPREKEPPLPLGEGWGEGSSISETTSTTARRRVCPVWGQSAPRCKTPGARGTRGQSLLSTQRLRVRMSGILVTSVRRLSDWFESEWRGESRIATVG